MTTIAADLKLHSTNDCTMREIETGAFEGKCTQFWRWIAYEI